MKQLNLIKEQLKIVEPFKDLPDEQLKWLAEKSTVEKYQEGEKIFSKNEPFNNMRVILDGIISISFEQKGHYREIARVEKGEITGLLPYSRATNHIGTGFAMKQTAILTLHKKHFPEMIRLHHDLVEVLVHNMLSRVRELSKVRHHDEKLISLGRLSAGLAHELNNPSSAMLRSARELKKSLREGSDKLVKVITAGLNQNQMTAIKNIFSAKVMAIGAQENLSLFEKTERIDELADWLEEHGIEDGYSLAETFFDYQFSANDLNELHRLVSEESLPTVLEWMENELSTEILVQQIEEAANRVTGLVESIKTYSHMDQTPDKQPIDISQGLTSTLTMLNHKLKTKNIRVDLNLQDDLPQVNVYVGELNQVWTNIIDNAIDAMDKDGILEIKIERDGQSVLIKIIDNGTGIDEEHQAQIFDPFFTTKSVGKGTGLGLDIVQKIIRHHNGEIKLMSKPGRTEFRISLPVE